MQIGILALHGNLAEHEAVLQKLGHQARPVLNPEDLDGLSHLIIPGGESTVISKLLEENGLQKPLTKRVEEGSLSIFGTCAGAILLANLGLMDMAVERNAYGPQIHSFRTELAVQGIDHPIAIAFIRAPKISHVGKELEVLAEHEGNPVLVRQGKLLAATFHAEQTGETAVHELWLSQ